MPPRNLGVGLRAYSDNRERALWQSYLTRNGKRAQPIEVVNLHQLARDVRRGAR